MGYFKVSPWANRARRVFDASAARRFDKALARLESARYRLRETATYDKRTGDMQPETWDAIGICDGLISAVQRDAQLAQDDAKVRGAW